jgi:hypothetical protein
VNRMPAPRDHAASVIAPKHQPAYCWWDGLDRALQLDASLGFRAHVGVFIDRLRAHARVDTVDTSKLLRIASGHLDHLRSNADLLAVSLHDSTLAALAHRHRHLVARTSWVRRSFKHRARHEQQGPIVIERLAGVAPNLGQRLAHAGQHLPGHLEAKHVTLQARVLLIARAAAGDVPGYELFHIAYCLARSGGEPFAFRLRRRHAR